MILSPFSHAVVMADAQAAELFLRISWIAILVAGFSFFLLGVFLGKFIWGAYKGRAKVMEKGNQSLLLNLEKMEDGFQQHWEKYRGKERKAETKSE